MRFLLLATLLVPTLRAPGQEAALAERSAPTQQRTLAEPRAAHERTSPTERFDVARVVDGDTLHVLRDGKLEKLRLLCVDTEERLGTGGFQGSASKPQTVFGEECALWAQRLFTDLADEDGTTRVGLLFPGGHEQVDPFGRLLCHVILPDGTDFNLELVRRGKSPYFNKYGNSEVCHAEFESAQAHARAAGIGIWAAGVNEPASEGTPAARRPYELLLPWWQARADAIEAFRAAHAEAPERFVACDDLDAMAAAAKERRAVTAFR
jgi:micrococcal nuclease